MAHSVCPHWLGYWLLMNPLRRFLHKPEKMLAGRVGPGATVLEVGPAMGYFTLPMARMAGPDGKVVCVDVQKSMLDALSGRAARAGLAERLALRCCRPESLGIEDYDSRIDFALVFYVVHEVPDVPGLFAQIARALKPGALAFVAEPKGHVNAAEFDRTLDAAAAAGLKVDSRPKVAWSRAAVLRKA